MTNRCFKEAYELLDAYPMLEESVVWLKKIHMCQIPCSYTLIINRSDDQDEVRFNLGFTSTARLSSDHLALHIACLCNVRDIQSLVGLSQNIIYRHYISMKEITERHISFIRTP